MALQPPSHRAVDADGAWVQGPYGGHLTAKRVDQLYDLINEWED